MEDKPWSKLFGMNNTTKSMWLDKFSTLKKSWPFVLKIKYFDIHQRKYRKKNSMSQISVIN